MHITSKVVFWMLRNTFQVEQGIFMAAGWEPLSQKTLKNSHMNCRCRRCNGVFKWEDEQLHNEFRCPKRQILYGTKSSVRKFTEYSKTDVHWEASNEYSDGRTDFRKICMYYYMFRGCVRSLKRCITQRYP
jgi:hypothetical protein